MNKLYTHADEAPQEPDTKPGPYFVTAIDQGPAMTRRVMVMSGPYNTHQQALDAVGMARDTASDIDGRAWFMAWGTARIPDRTQPGNLEKMGLA